MIDFVQFLLVAMRLPEPLNRQFCNRLLRMSAGPPMGNRQRKKRRSARPRHLQDASFVNELGRTRRRMRRHCGPQTRWRYRRLCWRKSSTSWSARARSSPTCPKSSSPSRLDGRRAWFWNQRFRLLPHTHTWLSGRILSASTPRSLFFQLSPFGILPNHVYWSSYFNTSYEVKTRTHQKYSVEAPNPLETSSGSNHHKRPLQVILDTGATCSMGEVDPLTCLNNQFW